MDLICGISPEAIHRPWPIRPRKGLYHKDRLIFITPMDNEYVFTHIQHINFVYKFAPFTPFFLIIDEYPWHPLCLSGWYDKRLADIFSPKLFIS